MFLFGTTIYGCVMQQFCGKRYRMETTNLVEALTAFGLTRQEAQIYLELLEGGSRNGYEVAKAAGISRSNAYSGLSGLVEKGAAVSAEGKTKIYRPVEPGEFLEHKLRSLRERKAYLLEHLPCPRQETEGYLTITGDDNVTNKMYHMMQQAGQRLYLSIARPLLAPFIPTLAALLQEGRKVVVLTDGPLELPGALIYVTEERGAQIGLITDSAYVLTGELGKGKHSVCLYSGQENFVRVFKDSLRNEIKLIELTGETKREETKRGETI